MSATQDQPKTETAGAATPSPTPEPGAAPPAGRVITLTAPFDRFAGRVVVVDTETSLVYIGTLIGADDWFIELADADCHDRVEAHSTNEKYVMEASKYGVKTNRKRVSIMSRKVVSISRVEDVIQY